MNNREFWMQSAIAGGVDFADDLLKACEERFPSVSDCIEGEGRPHLYTLEDYSLGVKVGGFTYYAQWSDAYKQYIVKAEIGGFYSPPMYTNARTAEEFEIFLQQNGEFVFGEAMKDAKLLFEQSKNN